MDEGPFTLSEEQRRKLTQQLVEACMRLEEQQVFEVMDALSFGRASLTRSMKQIRISLTDLQLVAGAAAFRAYMKWANAPSLSLEDGIQDITDFEEGRLF